MKEMKGNKIQASLERLRHFQMFPSISMAPKIPPGETLRPSLKQDGLPGGTGSGINLFPQ